MLQDDTDSENEDIDTEAGGSTHGGSTTANELDTDDNLSDATTEPLMDTTSAFSDNTVDDGISVDSAPVVTAPSSPITYTVQEDPPSDRPSVSSSGFHSHRPSKKDSKKSERESALLDPDTVSTIMSDLSESIV